VEGIISISTQPVESTHHECWVMTTGTHEAAYSTCMADGMRDCQPRRHGRNDWLSSHRRRNTCNRSIPNNPTHAPSTTSIFPIQLATLTGRVIASWLTGGVGLTPVLHLTHSSCENDRLPVFIPDTSYWTENPQPRDLLWAKYSNIVVSLLPAHLTSYESSKAGTCG